MSTEKPKIEKGKAPKGRKPSKWNFEGMVPGDSFYFEGKQPSQVAIAYGYWLAHGKYTIEKEGNGYRFHLTKKGKVK